MRPPLRVDRGAFVSSVDRILAAAILFVNGWMLTLPVMESPPWWATPVQIVHGVFAHEVLFAGYLLFILCMYPRYFGGTSAAAWRYAALIALLGGCGILSGVVNVRPLREVGSAGRYFVLALYFLCACRWAARYRPAFVLRNLLAGCAAAGAVNLYFTFTTSPYKLGGLPMLLGQNGPGGHFGIGVILAAWLMLVRQRKADPRIAVSMLAIGVFGASISFSKLAMLMAAAGLVAWVFVVGRNFGLRRSRRWAAGAVLLLIAAVIIRRDVAAQYVMGVQKFIEIKFIHLNERSVGERSQYFVITAEILASHPFFGVGYGGFYDAALRTRAYWDYDAAFEDPEAGARGETNPHSSFLYYASANGLPGLLVVMALFVTALASFWFALGRAGTAARVLFCCLCAGYLVFAGTLPTLFNTSVLYLPAAVAVTMSRVAAVHARPRGRQLEKWSKPIAVTTS